ncbi:MAG: phage tail protein [Deltaproteobacteria bacterium]|nr:MAG: phage tail protein [Deltaproteobacteria bacterium]
MSSQPYLGQLMLFGGNFAPRGWAFCDGQLLPISQNSALFSLLGTIYGGDGRTTFALPDLRGRAPIHKGNGPGLSNYNIGAKAGTERITLNVNQLPSHSHTVRAYNGTGGGPNPNNGVLSTYGSTLPPVGPYSTQTPNTNLSTQTIANTGGNQQVDIRQPVLAMSWCIALVGIYPSRS